MNELRLISALPDLYDESSTCECVAPKQYSLELALPKQPSIAMRNCNIALTFAHPLVHKLIQQIPSQVYTSYTNTHHTSHTHITHITHTHTHITHITHTHTSHTHTHITHTHTHHTHTHTHHTHTHTHHTSHITHTQHITHHKSMKQT